MGSIKHENTQTSQFHLIRNRTLANEPLGALTSFKCSPGNLRAFHMIIVLSIDADARKRPFHDHSTARTWKPLQFLLFSLKRSAKIGHQHCE